MRKVIITGATGMLGATLTEYMANQDIQVLAICRKNTSKLHNIVKHPNVKIQLADLSELKDITSTEKYDVFFHLAWEGTSGKDREDSYLQNLNIKYSLDAVQIAYRLGCHTFVGAGSQAEYGRVNEKLSSCTSVNPESGYGIAKYAAGKLSALYAKQLGIKHIWSRILSVYGPKDGDSTMIMSTIYKLLNREIPDFSRAEQIWDYLYNTDAARALYLIAEKGKDQGIYCIGSGEAIPLKSYIYQIRDNIDKKLPIRIGEIPYSEKQVMYLCADIDELAKDVGFVPEVSFEEGIRETIEYCKKMNNEC